MMLVVFYESMFGGSMLHCVLHQQLNRLLFVWGLHVKLSEPAEIQIIVSTRDRGGIPSNLE